METLLQCVWFSMIPIVASLATERAAFEVPKFEMMDKVTPKRTGSLKYAFTSMNVVDV